MGVPIEGAGTSTIRIQGRASRKGATHRLQGDYIEAGSWAVVAAITGGAAEVRGVRDVDMEPIVNVLQRMKLRIDLDAKRLGDHRVAGSE